MLVLGMVLLVAGVATIVASFWAGKWSGMLLQLLVGILYVVVGLQITDTPVVAGAVTAVFLAAFFIVVGRLPHRGRLDRPLSALGLGLLNGVITFLCGVIIYRHFPEAALWVIGVARGRGNALQRLDLDHVVRWPSDASRIPLPDASEARTAIEATASPI